MVPVDLRLFRQASANLQEVKSEMRNDANRPTQFYPDADPAEAEPKPLTRQDMLAIAMASVPFVVVTSIVLAFAYWVSLHH